MTNHKIGADMAALEERYGPGMAQYLADQMAQAIQSKPIELLDVKERNDNVAAMRARIRELIAACRATGTGADTALLHHQINEMRDAYRSAFLDSRIFMAEYLRRLSGDGVSAMHITTQKSKAA